MRAALIVMLLVTAPLAATAEVFRNITAKSDFVSLIEGRKLTRTGIELDVTRTGQIVGRGFGRNVTGKWTWRDGFFCRDLAWGQRDLGFDCQMVGVRGNTLRFTSKKGTGRHADLSLE